MNSLGKCLVVSLEPLKGVFKHVINVTQIGVDMVVNTVDVVVDPRL